ncbi:MAG: Slp family lipoprotein [Nitrosomonas sp.]|nr:Slp family lipoprotein [Nitrosomonas sp.]
MKTGIKSDILGETMRLFLIAIGLLLGACSSMPPSLDDTRIKNISYAQASADAQSYQNTLVRWGGVVVEVKQEDKDSIMQVLYYPLDYYGRPDIDKPSEGYFLVKSTQTLDPKIFFASREIVVVGAIAGKTEPAAESGRAGLPLLNATTIHPWPIAYRDNYYRYCPDCYFRQLFW